MSYILNKLKKKQSRSAFFISSLSIKYPRKRIITVMGKVNGTISKKILGNKGFGYDSIFIPKNYKITYGQMIQSKKVLIDHRFLAFKKLKKKIKIL